MNGFVDLHGASITGVINTFDRVIFKGHLNFGDSDDWGDLEKFEAAALKMLADQLGETPVVV